MFPLHIFNIGHMMENTSTKPGAEYPSTVPSSLLQATPPWQLRQLLCRSLGNLGGAWRRADCHGAMVFQKKRVVLQSGAQKKGLKQGGFHI